MIAEDVKRKLAKKLQQIPENTLTKTVIMPVLEKMGFKKVEFFGGTSERGKDIVFWEQERLGGDRLLVAQVKHFKFTKTASDSKSFQTVVNQLINSFQDDLYGTDQFPYPPSQAFLISTHEIDTAVLQTRLGKHNELKNKVKIIDGIDLAKLIITYYPEYAEEKLGVSTQFKNKLGDYLNNEILLKAIGFNKTKDLKVIYTDIDFSVGRNTTELFFNTDFDPVDAKFDFEEVDYLSLRNDLEKLAVEYSTGFLKVELDQVELRFKKIIEKNIEIENQKNILKQNLVEISNKKYDVEKQQAIDIDKINLKLAKLNNKKQSLLVGFPLYGSKISEQIVQKRKWIEEQVEAFNKRRPSAAALKAFIKRSRSIIETSSIFFTRNYFRRSLGVDSSTQYRRSHEATRFKLPISQVFDTGENIIVLGEAGAGKSTSVQMYALNSADLDEPLVICIPLANAMQSWEKLNDGFTEHDRSDHLEVGITAYLNYKGLNLTSDEFIGYLKTRKVVLLLDGLDEAVKPSPWLPKAIVKLSERYQKTQIVVTSRVSGSYLSEIPFFAVTLMPFTTAQRNSFIRKWFEKSEEKYADIVRAHLNNNAGLAEIASSPLLLTTLCVLARNQVPLPFTEIRLYDDRLKLLTGYYDRVKNIQQRLENTPHVLETVARKLAYHLHSQNKREEFPDELRHIAALLCINKISAQEAMRAVSELIDPCNILVPMTDDGKVGFGHLRFQEHLCAREICQHRGIKIIHLLNQPWWKATLLLYAQMDDDLDWLINEAGEGQYFVGNYGMLKNMINVRPVREREGLMIMLRTFFDAADDDMR